MGTGLVDIVSKNGVITVSIQLMSPASGDSGYAVRLRINVVSIQLMSPASGDSSWSMAFVPWLWCFHSINVPSKWGQNAAQLLNNAANSFHSINVPSEWGHLLLRFKCFLSTQSSFHSINVPSEWGLTKLKENLYRWSCFHSINVPSEWGPPKHREVWICFLVSIQLMSPASGDSKSVKKTFLT